MGMPRLWTNGRRLELAGLICLGIFQAAAALGVALAGTQLLSGASTPLSQAVIGPVAVLGACLIVCLRIVQRRWAEKFALAYVNATRSALMSHVMRMPALAKSARLGLVMTRVVNDMTAVKNWLANGLVASTVALAILLTVGSYLIVFEPRILAILAPSCLIWTIVIVCSIAPLDRRIRESRRQRGRIAASAASALTSRLTLLVNGCHGKTNRVLERRAQKLATALIGRATISGLMRSSGELILPIVAVGFAVSAIFFQRQALDTTQVGVLIVILGLVVAQLNVLALAAEYKLAHRVALSRIAKLFDDETMLINVGEEPLNRSQRGRRLIVEDLRVNEIAPAISFDAKPGVPLAIRGLDSKTLHLVFTMLAGLHPLEYGIVQIDGRDFGTIQRRDWWRNVTLVSADLPFVRGTVRDNACLGAARSIAGADRNDLLERFGLAKADLTMEIGDGKLPPPEIAAAIRAARAILRHTGIILVSDNDVFRNSSIIDRLLDEAVKREKTLILGQLPSGLIRYDHEIVEPAMVGSSAGQTITTIGEAD